MEFTEFPKMARLSRQCVCLRCLSGQQVTTHGPT